MCASLGIRQGFERAKIIQLENNLAMYPVAQVARLADFYIEIDIGIFIQLLIVRIEEFQVINYTRQRGLDAYI